MAPRWAAAGGLCTFFICGCVDPLRTGALGDDPAVEQPRLVAVEPAPSDRGVSNVARFLFALPASTKIDALMLFSGELDAYYLRRISNGELPSTLRAREIELTSWLRPTEPGASDAGSSRVVEAAPQHALTAGETYTWVVGSFGVVSVFGVANHEPDPLQRYWPATGSAFTGRAVYCSADPHELTPQSITLDPVGMVAELKLGVGDEGVDPDHCVHFAVNPAVLPPRVLPPPTIGAMTVDPEPLTSSTPPSVEPAACGAQGRIGPGCIAIADDRFVIEPPEQASLWSFMGRDLSFHTIARGDPFVVKGLLPQQTITASYEVTLESGVTYAGRAELTTSGSVPHVVINEVMANPRGPEPDQEWIELYNDGSATVDLAGWSIADGGATATLPAWPLASGAFVVVANQSFSDTVGDDVHPGAGVAVLRVPQLGKSGISNAGEALTLRAPGGASVSRFPALASPLQGVSLARRTPEAADDASSSFALHAEPGASPGAVNVMRVPD